MISQDKLEKFAELAVRVGANMQKGQEVAIRCDVAVADFAHLIAEKAYQLGARRVHMQWRDERAARIDMDLASEEALTDIPSYDQAMNEYFIARKCCLISISAGDPNIFKGCDSEKVARVDVAKMKANERFMKATMSNELRWTIVSVPTANWAKTVFPDLEPEVAVEKMWDAIASVMRLNEPDPTAAWKKHIETLHRRADYLNERNFEFIRLRSGNGTDLSVGLAIGHVWLAAEEVGQDGIAFTANMPTEEIFTAPHREKVNGVVKNALPLVYNGNVIDNFSVTFESGKVKEFSADVGYDALKGLLSADEGVLRLGEIALIGKHSPISETGILFFNTLFDENASCHLAFGKAYPTTVKNGNDMTEKELRAAGVNDSIQHEDFMVGTKDLSVEGIAFDGTVVKLFEDGEWTI